MNINALNESPLVRGAAEARHPTRWWIAALLIVVVGVILVGEIVMLAYARIFDYAAGSLTAQGLELFTNAGTLLVLWLWLRFKEKRAFASVGFRSGQPLLTFFAGVGIGAGMITLVVAILVAIGEYHRVPTPTGALGGGEALVPVLLLAAVWAVQASTEETMMRGYLLQTAGLQLPGWLALLLPGLIFSAMHFATEDPQVVAGVNILLFALFVSFLALRQGSLWMACGIHMGWNWFQGNVFTLPVSGNVYANGIFHFAPVGAGPPWLAGGDFGPENSVVVTLVWGAAAFIGYRYFRSTAPSPPL